MRVLFIHNRYQQPGGEDRAVELESNLLLEKGHDVQILFFENRGITDTGVQKIRTFKNAISNPGSAAILRHNILEFKPDIIHVHNIFFVASSSVLEEAARQQIPVVATLHNYRIICCNAVLLRNNMPCELCIRHKFPLSGIRYRCYRNSALASAMVTMSTGLPKIQNKWKRWVSQYIVLTEFARGKFADSSLGANPDQLRVKPNFVNDTGEGSPFRKDYFLFVGRIAEEKGVYALMEAFKHLPEKKLMVVGDGPEKQKLLDQYKSAENIQFLGNRNHTEVISLMKESIALVFPSIWYEGLPFVILEAFSTGTPVLASNLGAMSVMVQDGYNGVHFKPNDRLDLQEAIIRFGKTNQSMYANARKTFLEHYNADIHYRSVMEIYEQSIRNCRGRNQ